MIALILYFCICLVFIAAVVLLSLIKDKAARIISIIMMMIIFVGSTTFALYKTSGQQDFLKTFDSLTNLAGNQTSSWNNSDNFNENEAVSTLNDFLDAWQQQDIDDLSGLVTDVASQKLNSELPLNKQPQIISYEIISVGDYDSQTGILPIQVKVTIFYNDGTEKEIIFDYYLTFYYGYWYITDGVRQDGNQSLFSFAQTHEATNTQPSNPITSAANNAGAVLKITGDTLVAGGANTVGLKADGTVVAVGLNDSGQCNVQDWQDIVAISSNGSRTMGLKSDGTVVAVGDNTSDQAVANSHNIEHWESIVAISDGPWHTLGLKSDGTVVAVGGSGMDYGQFDIESWQNIIAISAGVFHSVGLKADGSVVAVGGNDGQSSVQGWQNIVAVFAGYNYTLGVKADGTVVAVGDNSYGQCDVQGWQDIAAVSGSDVHSVGLKSDGTIVIVGFKSMSGTNLANIESWQDVESWQNIVAISVGGYHTVGLKADGSIVVVCNNDGDWGQTDVDDWQNIAVPSK